jgi:hypothetical protein
VGLFFFLSFCPSALICQCVLCVRISMYFQWLLVDHLCVLVNEHTFNVCALHFCESYENFSHYYFLVSGMLYEASDMLILMLKSITRTTIFSFCLNFIFIFLVCLWCVKKTKTLSHLQRN